MHSFRAQKVVENANQSDFLSAMHSFRAQKVVENATHWKKINIRFKGLPFQAFLPSLAFLPCPFYLGLQSRPWQWFSSSHHHPPGRHDEAGVTHGTAKVDKT